MLVANQLGSLQGVDAASPNSLLHARRSEYRGERVNGSDGSGCDAALRDCARRMAATIGIGDSAFFNDTVSSLLLKQFVRWGVRDLLRR